MLQRVFVIGLVALTVVACRQPAPPELVDGQGSAVARVETPVEDVATPEGSGVAKDAASVIRAAFEEGRLPSGDGPVALAAEPGSLVMAPSPAALERWLAGDAAAIEYVSLLTLGTAGPVASIVEGPGVSGALPNVVISPFVGGQQLSVGDFVLAPYGMTDALRPAILVEAGDPAKVLFTGTAITPPAEVSLARVMAITPMGAGSTVACHVGESRVAHGVLLRMSDRALLRAPGGAVVVGSLESCEPAGLVALPGEGERASIAVSGGMIAEGTVRHVDAANLRVGVEVVGNGRMAVHWGTRADLFMIRSDGAESGAQ